MYNPTIGVSDNLKLRASETKRDTQVAEQLQIQGKLIDELASVISTLSENLKSVRRLSPKCTNDEISPDQLVPLAETIRNNNSYIISNIDSIRNIINELEL